jgi:hypothetical protein
MNGTFSNTEFEFQGNLYKAGDVLIMTNLGGGFDSCTVLGFTAPDKYGDTYAKLARPMAYATCVGTTCPGVALTCETFEVHTNKLSGFVKRDQGFAYGH